MYEFPSKIMIELTNSCNLNCDYCFRSKKNMKGKVMKWDCFTDIVENLGAAKNIAFCGMGEQLLHPRFYDAVKYLADRHINVDIITNGTIPIAFEKLVEYGNINGVTFSVDGTKQEIIQKVCSEYDIAKLIKNLEAGKKLEKLTKSVNFVMNKDTISDAVNMPSFCQKHGIQELNILLPTYSLKWIEKNKKTIATTLESIEQRCISNGVHYHNPYEMYCFYKGVPIPFVSLDGVVRVCCDHFLNVSNIGSVLDTDFIDLYESEKYKNFREGTYCEKCKMYKNLPKV